MTNGSTEAAGRAGSDICVGWSRPGVRCREALEGDRDE